MKFFAQFKKTIYIGTGIVMLALGIIGIVLPILPTTPFLLLASYLFLRHSTRMHQWLIKNKVLGEYIYNYETYKAIKRKTKVRALILLWASLSFSIYLVGPIYLKGLLVLIGALVSLHILRIRTLEDISDKELLHQVTVRTSEKTPS